MDAKIARGSKRAELLIINFGNAANVQTENAPSRTLQNYQQLNLEETDRDLNPADLKKDDGERIKKKSFKRRNDSTTFQCSRKEMGGADPLTTSLIKPLISAALRVNLVLFCVPVGLKCAAGGDYVAQPFQKSHLSLLPHDPPASQRFYSDSQTRLHLQEEEDQQICTLGFVVLMSRFKLVRLPSLTNTEQRSNVKTRKYT